MDDLQEAKQTISSSYHMLSASKELLRLADQVEDWQSAHPGEPLPIQAKPRLLREAAQHLLTTAEAEVDSANASITAQMEVRHGQS